MHGFSLLALSQKLSLFFFFFFFFFFFRKHETRPDTALPGDLWAARDLHVPTPVSRVDVNVSPNIGRDPVSDRDLYSTISVTLEEELSQVR